MPLATSTAYGLAAAIASATLHRLPDRRRHGRIAEPWARLMMVEPDRPGTQAHSLLRVLEPGDPAELDPHARNDTGGPPERRERAGQDPSKSSSSTRALR